MITENGLLNGFLTLKVSRNFDFESYIKTQCEFGWKQMILLTVHATYRALLVSGVRPVVLHAISASIFAASTILHTLTNHNLTATFEFTVLSYVVIVFNGVVMVFFFSLSQITIICTMSRVYKTSVSSAIVAKMLIRCVLYALLSVAFIMLASM
ncbi:hypothetical protein DFJ73DRAFT_859772 [Zopfochytrium polystomum]|nr:hypothetical protein DFJ73DRAFT_859772 [Zopfochytrium polystomum]